MAVRVEREAIDASVRRRPRAIAERPAGRRRPGESKEHGRQRHPEQLVNYRLLEKGPESAGDDVLARIYGEDLEESRRHGELLERRLEAAGGSPSTLKDAAMRLGALNWGAFFAAQPDTPGELAAFAFAFEHLEIAGYEELKRVAERTGDTESVQLADPILPEERRMAERLADAFDRDAGASLAPRGVV